MTTLDIPMGARVRQALVEAPGERQRALPLLLMFHGAGATAALASTNTGWGEFARRTGIIAVFPEGTRRNGSQPASFRHNPQAWNDGSGRGHVPRSGIDDVEFARAIIDAVSERWEVDRTRVYATGFSNGASLVFRLGAELGDRIAAVAPVAGHLWLSDPRPARPVPLLLISGTADPLNPIGGGVVETPWGRTEEHPPIADSARRWAVATGCDPEPRTMTEQPGIQTLRWGGPEGRDVRFTAVEGLGHAWPGGRRLLPEWIGGPSSDLLDGTTAIWRFLSGHHL